MINKLAFFGEIDKEERQVKKVYALREHFRDGVLEGFRLAVIIANQLDKYVSKENSGENVLSPRDYMAFCKQFEDKPFTFDIADDIREYVLATLAATISSPWHITDFQGGQSQQTQPPVVGDSAQT